MVRQLEAESVPQYCVRMTRGSRDFFGEISRRWPTRSAREPFPDMCLERTRRFTATLTAKNDASSVGNRCAALFAALVAGLDERHRSICIVDRAQQLRVFACNKTLQIRDRSLERFGKPRAAPGDALPYDILIYARQLPEAVSFVDRHPTQRFVLDHLAKPPIASGELEPWAKELRRLAERANVWLKVSGLVSEARWDC
jgi:hypothetical protein